MPRKKKTSEDEANAAIDELLQDSTPQDLIKLLTARVVERALEGELTAHLDYEKGEEPPEEQTNRRNGHRQKTVRTDRGKVDIRVPRDRAGSFEPQLIKRYERVIPGFSDKILGLYARGMSVREIRDFFEEEYGTDVGPNIVTRVTESVVEDLKAWQSRPLESVYPVIYIDALVVKVRDEGVVQKKSLYLVVGIDDEGDREVLGLWLQKTEGAKFWLSILNELRHRGVEDVLFLCADGLTGLPEAVEASFPHAVFQTCVVHLIRSSTRLVPWKEKKAVCRDLKALYTAESIEAARAALDELDERWGSRFPMVVTAWRSRFEEWTPFLEYSPELRRIIYTTNTIEATNRQLRKVLKTKGHLPSDEAVLKLVYMVLRTNQKGWRKKRRSHEWATVRLQLALQFGDRFPVDQ